MPDKFRVSGQDITSTDAAACESIAGTYAYWGKHVGSEQEDTRPSVGRYILAKDVPVNWGPDLVEVSVLRLGPSQYAATFVVKSASGGSKPLFGISVQGFCVGGLVRLLREDQGTDSAGRILSWLVQDLERDERGSLNVVYAHSSRSDAGSFEVRTSKVQFPPR